MIIVAKMLIFMCREEQNCVKSNYKKVKDDESSSSKEFDKNYSKYYWSAPNSATLSTVSQSSQKILPKFGDHERFSKLSVHKVFVSSSSFKEEDCCLQGSNDVVWMKLKFLIPYLPSYLVSPFSQ